MEAIQAWAQSVWEQIDFNLIQGDRYLMMLDGLKVTLQISVAAAVIGVLLGSFIALMRLSNARIGKWYFLRSIATWYVDIIRGTPVVVQLMIMYYIIMVSWTDPLPIGIATFGFNSAAYVSEMVRAGILAVDKGQTEAGRSLGLSSASTMMLIVLPQALKVALPSLLNEFIALLKETAIVGYVGMMDLTKAGDFIRSRTFSAFFPLIAVALVYLILVTTLSRLFARIERRIRLSDQR